MLNGFRVKGLAGAVALSFMAAAASATPVDLTYKGPSAGDAKSVQITAAPGGPEGSGAIIPLNAGAFGFRMRTDNSDPLTEFLAWCLDIGSYLGTNGAYGYEITKSPFTNSFGLNPTERSRVQKVFDANYATLVKTDGVQAAGFQVALWNSLYDSDKDAGDGAFKISSTYNSSASAIIAQANTFLNLADAYTDDKAFNLTFFESTETNPKRQNLVSATPVPLPAAGLLFLGALGGLAAIRRRKRAL